VTAALISASCLARCASRLNVSAMRRHVRVNDDAFQTLVAQLDGSVVGPEGFVRLDLAREVDLLADHYDTLPIRGPALARMRRSLESPDVP